MAAVLFPSEAWLRILEQKLNSDEHYAAVAAKWEGDIFFDIQTDNRLAAPVGMYLDLWHGKCTGVAYGTLVDGKRSPRFILASSYANFAAILLGQLNAMTAMLTNRLRVTGDLSYMMRNVPTVLDFVRCAQEITTDVL
ncbi:MAG TPA: SCP2 sterol-binding domain-containing protein [Anaerolineales bacterium]|nr:SCP2 sterol-binding domain-containing protein [Anaerolineales bacterium]